MLNVTLIVVCSSPIHGCLILLKGCNSLECVSNDNNAGAMQLRSDYLQITNGFYFKMLPAAGGTPSTQKFVANSFYCGVGESAKIATVAQFYNLNKNEQRFSYSI